jgi:outer membrane protein assembly factor BamE (lipoprotein component of BamABCDE complex)
LRSSAKTLVRILPTLAFALGLPACSVIGGQTVYRGQTADPRDVYELVPGVSTKADVQEQLGSPTNIPSFDPNTWLYLSQQTHIRIARVPGIREQQVTVVRFDDKGVVKSVDTKEAPNGMQLAMAGGATPSPGSEASFLGQLIGNIGKFSPTGGGGANSPLSGFASTSSRDLGEGGTTPGVNNTP